MELRKVHSFLVLLIFAIALQSCSDPSSDILQEDKWMADVDGVPVHLAYSREIHLNDDQGNSLSFTIYSSSEELVNSYSEDNYSFTGLTAEEVSAQAQTGISHDEYEFDENLEGFSSETLVYSAISEVELSLADGFYGYTLTEKWEAPEEIEDRGFDWHWEPATTYDAIRVKNLRCCWSIYADWYLQRENSVNLEPWVIGVKIKGGNTKSGGWRDSIKMQVRVRYRKSSHRSLTYLNMHPDGGDIWLPKSD